MKDSDARLIPELIILAACGLSFEQWVRCSRLRLTLRHVASREDAESQMKQGGKGDAYSLSRKALSEDPVNFKQFLNHVLIEKGRLGLGRAGQDPYSGLIHVMYLYHEEQLFKHARDHLPLSDKLTSQLKEEIANFLNALLVLSIGQSMYYHYDSGLEEGEDAYLLIKHGENALKPYETYYYPLGKIGTRPFSAKQVVKCLTMKNEKGWDKLFIRCRHVLKSLKMYLEHQSHLNDQIEVNVPARKSTIELPSKKRIKSSVVALLEEDKPSDESDDKSTTPLKQIRIV